MIGGRGPCPLFNYTLVLVLQARKSTGNLSQDNRLVLDTSSCVDSVILRSLYMFDKGLPFSLEGTLG
jgi:hypothetical protein